MYESYFQIILRWADRAELHILGVHLGVVPVPQPDGRLLHVHGLEHLCDCHLPLPRARVRHGPNHAGPMEPHRANVRTL